MTQRMVDTLPDGTYSADCTDLDLRDCGHWVHAGPAVGLYVWSAKFDQFIAAKAFEAHVASRGLPDSRS